MNPLIGLWMERLCAADGDGIRGVCSLYANHAVLVPTFGYQAVQGHREIRRYMTSFVGERPKLCGEVATVIKQAAGKEFAIESGEYDFWWQGSQVVRARYTIVYGLNGIVTHHSSEVPS